jgi:hypothetical protein
MCYLGVTLALSETVHVCECTTVENRTPVIIGSAKTLMSCAGILEQSMGARKLEPNRNRVVVLARQAT